MTDGKSETQLGGCSSLVTVFVRKLRGSPFASFKLLVEARTSQNNIEDCTYKNGVSSKERNRFKWLFNFQNFLGNVVSFGHTSRL